MHYIKHLDPEVDKYEASVPQEIGKHIPLGETFERLYRLQDGAICITNKRLLLKKGPLIRDFDFHDIKYVEHKKCKRCVMLYGGILLVVLAFGFNQLLGIGWLTPSVLGVLSMGVILFVAGLVPKSKVELKVTGQSLPLEISAAGEYELSSIHRLIAEKIT